LSLRARLFSVLFVILVGAAIVIWFGIKPSYEDAIMEERLTLITEYQQQRIREAEIQLFFWLKTTTELQELAESNPDNLQTTFYTYTRLFPDLLAFYHDKGTQQSIIRNSREIQAQHPINLSDSSSFLVNPNPILRAGWFDFDKKFHISISDSVNGEFRTVTTIFDATKMNQIMLQNVLRGDAFTSIWKPDSTTVGRQLDQSLMPAEGPTTMYYSQMVGPTSYLAVSSPFTSLPLVHTIYVDQSYLQRQVSQLFSQSLIMLIITFFALAAAGQLLISRVQRPVKMFLDDVGPFANYDFNTPFREIDLPELSGIAEKMEDIRQKLLHYKKINVEQIILHDHRNRLLMNHAIEMVAELNDKDEFIFVNQPLRELFSTIGLTDESLTSNQLFTHHQVRILDKKQDTSTRDHLIITSHVYTIEIDLPDENIGYYQIQLNRVADQDEKNLGAMMLVINQTKDKEIEKMRSEMANMIIHELQNPVNAGLGLTSYLIEDITISEKERTDILTLVRQSLDSIMQLIDRFLKISRLESVTIRIDRVNIDLNKLIQPICDSFKSQLDEKHLDLIVNLEPVPVILGSIDMIEDVIKNLISNAIKYGPEHRVIYIALWSTSEKVYLSVTDNGYGIPDEHLEKIFQKFYRINEYSKEKGTGLGLSYVWQVIKKHQGEIKVESDKGFGSRFTISLPVSDKS